MRRVWRLEFLDRFVFLGEADVAEDEDEDEDEELLLLRVLPPTGTLRRDPPLVQ